MRTTESRVSARPLPCQLYLHCIAFMIFSLGFRDAKHPSYLLVSHGSILAIRPVPRHVGFSDHSLKIYLTRLSYADGYLYDIRLQLCDLSKARGFSRVVYVGLQFYRRIRNMSTPSCTLTHERVQLQTWMRVRL